MTNFLKCYPLSVLAVVIFKILTVDRVACVTNSGNSNVDQFRYCIREPNQRGLCECFGRTAIIFLQSLEETENFTLASGLIARRDDDIASRSMVNFLDQDPVDFRGILENAGAVFSERSLHWHMDGIYPGLMLKIGPTADSNSVAEFTIDPSASERDYEVYEPSTPRLLTKKYLLPVLLGLKLKLIALMPLLFTGIVFLLKNSLFLAKFAIFLSSIFGTLSFGGLGGFGGFFKNFVHTHGHGGVGGAGLGAAAITNGYFPGKASLLDSYSPDEFYYNDQLLRNDRKVNFDKPRELLLARSSLAQKPDRFYDYERRIMMPDRNGKQYDKTTTENLNEEFGWKVVDV